MENHETTTEITTPKTAPLGGVGRSALAQAVLRATGREETHEEPEASGEPSSEFTEAELLNLAESGTEVEGDPQSADVQGADVWEFNGTDYSAEQVEESLRDREIYQRFNQSVQPLIDGLTQAQTANTRFKEMALTETEKQIAELEKAIKDRRLDARQELAARHELERLSHRQKDLKDAADEAEKVSANALIQARTQNARQVVSTLTRQGWTPQDVKSIAVAAQAVIGDKFADVMSPELMQIFRDAAKTRAAQTEAAKRLKVKSSDALKTAKTPPRRPVAAQKGKQTFGQKVWGDRYK